MIQQRASDDQTLSFYINSEHLKTEFLNEDNKGKIKISRSHKHDEMARADLKGENE